ncbi:WhiB family transcriptional regulator [Streptomyces sp. NPDC056227]|uniref:WhiB family transcriptional regulator n=1 Tax=Streptomyces sp. NPDC056227 TaxID=3345753 RepID=UPI0035E0B551
MTTTAIEPAAVGVTPRNTLDGWQQHGLCRFEDPDLFFPGSAGPQAAEQTAKAKQVCARCPVIETCLQWAMDTRQDIGVLGGLSEGERRTMHRRKTRRYGQAQLPAAQQILNYRMDEFKAAQERGLSEAEIAQALGTNVQTVNNVLEALVTAAVEAQSDGPDPIAVRNYLAGVDDGILPRDRLAAIVDGVRRGMKYPQFDALHGLTKGSTSTFMSRTRKAFKARGETFPDLGRQAGVRILTDAQVIAIREQCAAGATDTDVSLAFGVSRKTVTDVARGKKYRNVGGPLREERKEEPSAEQRVVWAGGAPVSEGSMSSMGEAA